MELWIIQNLKHNYENETIKRKVLYKQNGEQTLETAPALLHSLDAIQLLMMKMLHIINFYLCFTFLLSPRHFHWTQQTTSLKQFRLHVLHSSVVMSTRRCLALMASP